MGTLFRSVLDLFPINHPAFSGLARRSDQIFLLLNRDGSRLRFAGPGAGDYFPLNSTDADHRSWLANFPEEDRESLLNAFAELEKGAESLEDELRVNGKDGREYWLSVRVEAVRGRSGRLRRIAVICRDISELRESRLKLARAREYEVELGARIQQSLLLGRPQSRYDGMQVGAFTLPSQRIDGDFIDFFQFEDLGAAEFVVGDVMGKGVPAALLGAAARTALLKARTGAARGCGNEMPSMEAVLSATEELLAAELLKLNAFITLIYARIDRGRSLLRFIDCGHTSMIHYDARRGRCWRVKGVDMPLGFRRRQEYRALDIDLSPGDILFAYSDGITEAVNGEGELFGEERLMHLIRSSAGLDAEALLEKVKQITFAYGAGSFRDDVTAVAVKIDGERGNIEKFEEQFPQRLDSIRDIREFFNRTIRGPLPRRLEDEEIRRLEIAAAEAVSNILRHQEERPGEILRAGADCGEEWISFKIEYSGREYDWAQRSEPRIESYQESGYGLYLINSVMDSVLVEQGEMDRQRLVMVHYIGDDTNEI